MWDVDVNGLVSKVHCIELSPFIYSGRLFTSNYENNFGFWSKISKSWIISVPHMVLFWYLCNSTPISLDIVLSHALTAGTEGQRGYVCGCMCAKERRQASIWPMKTNYANPRTLPRCLSLTESFSCQSCTLVGAIMARSLVQISVFGLLLTLAATLPNKVRSVPHTHTHNKKI